ncbi:protein-L-isoaspartate(D-aspartate) O-methyltransferase [Herbaspirillum sp. RTI4]|uniref:protein-L-isoaspartate(D-aspartate) O-methyltransferase n=1 Tax=Herbaspirillum sp. RTI4 TaxID=3048640 RepID=UPI002AB49333|nr:protein-L-isoaspartate(D-aspartate) O-methyltransferase [Herbaspirillum sp. RTI4]MDY7578601.1 protein-L-isoaspartate(D-aspartate) O-methyltransferase [Herbaspirillum sp. RTI4]MEA9981093.1 protein-L-isoaspartate(D-aspartate) O-methyltransferase [Herbaspirillum sp. RTI4]
MTGKSSRFPLTLSSVVTTKTRGSTDSGRTATPQTATRNAAQQGMRPGTSVTQAAVNALRPTSKPTSGPLTAATPAPPRSLVTSRSSSLPVTQVSSATAPSRSNSMVSEAVRKAMVARVARQGVKDAKVLAAMEAVPRHLFMEPGLSSQAYIDASLPIGHHQTISQPYIVARMIEILRETGGGKELDKVLEIGTGCGYQAAVLSQVAKEVYSIERIRPLHELAKTNLRPLRIANLRLQYGDGMLGLPQAAPFDGIILAAAGMEVPQTLLEQLTIGGRLIAPVGGRHQVLQLIRRISKFEWTNETMEECHFVPLRPGIV